MSVYAATSLTGGGSGALDAIDGTNLAEADIAIVAPALGSVSVYTLDSDSGVAEAPPVTIAPNTNAGNKRWIISGTQLGGKEFKLDADGDTSITADTDDQIDFKCSNADQLVLIDGVLYPAFDNDIDLGSEDIGGGTPKEFKNAFFDGTVTTDALVADTADINGGTVDGAVIGGASAAAITCTTLTTGGKLTAAANEVEGSNFDINGGAIDGTTFGGAANNTYSDLMPAGTVVLFGQASAPNGWTKLLQADGWQDGAMIIINSDADGTALDSGGSVKAQTAHTHGMGTHVHQWYNFVDGSGDQSYSDAGGAVDISPASNGNTKILAAGTQGLAADYFTAAVDPGDTEANTEFYYQEAIWCTKD